MPAANGWLDRVESRRKRAAFPLVLRLIALTIFLPEELSFYVFGMRLTLLRTIFIIITPIVVVRFCQMLVDRHKRVVAPDAFVPMTAAWLLVGYASVDGLGDALAHMGPIILEFSIGYLAARTLLTEHGQCLSFVEVLCHAIAVVALLGLLDPLTNHWLIHDLARESTGYSSKLNTGWADAYRLGLLRAMGPIEHPILFGVTCAVGLLLAVTSQIRARLLTILSCSSGLFFSFSAAPIQAAVIGLALLFYDRMLLGVRMRWRALIFPCAIGLLVTWMLTNSPVSFIFEKIMFNQGSYWSRVYEWQTVGAVLVQSPWFGIADHWSEIAPKIDAFQSVDSLWLVTALTGGIPAAILLGLSAIGATYSSVTGPKADLMSEESKLATTLSILLFLLAFLGFTVHFWGSTWILFGILIGVRANLGALARRSENEISFVASSFHKTRSSIPNGISPFSNEQFFFEPGA
jgi:hypothetical protein